MPHHPRPLDIQTSADPALERELDDVGVEEGDDEDGAAVDAKESVTLSIAQNRWARFSAVGTFVLQLDTTHA